MKLFKNIVRVIIDVPIMLFYVLMIPVVLMSLIIIRIWENKLKPHD